jgi:ADP-ribosylglycohydrolase/protein-tyrosine phosphatase
MADDAQRQNPAPPIPNSYWVLPGRLLAGEYPGSTSRAEAMQRIEKLIAAGINSFLDLTEADELPAYHTLLAELTEQPLGYRRLSVTDHSIPESAQRMSDILDHLDAELNAGRRVYVHCRAGIGRTGTTIACHLIRSGLANDAAMERLQVLWRQCARSRSWPTVPETDEQIDFVRRWRDRTVKGTVQIDSRARYEGAIIGLAIGDALGTLVATSAFDAATLAMRAGDSGVLPTGADIAMTRAVIESLLAHQSHQPKDQLQRYSDWCRATTSPVPPELKRALAVWQWSKKANAGSHDPKNLDPHSLARTLAPSMFLASDVPAAIDLAVEVSRTTQQSPIVLDLCRVWAATLLDALHGTAKPTLQSLMGRAMKVMRERALKPPVRLLIDGKPAAQDSTVVDALSVARHALSSFAVTVSFRDALLQCVTQARASPSAAAMCGALAGAHYGIEAVPAEWRARLTDEPLLRSLARHCAH